METSAATRPLPRRGARALPAALLRVHSDERLVEHVRAGSEAAFEVLFDRHHRGILGFCRHMLGSAEEAEDAVQHTFMAAYRDLVGSDKPIQLRPWLYTIARNRCFSALRARRERPLGELDEPSTENLSTEVERRQDLRELLADVSGLPEDQRAALVLSELGAVSHDEIAAVLDVPREKVKALVFQARSSLLASRKARDTPCEEIREQIANLRGGALRRTTLRRHLNDCAGCRAFRDEVAAQRRALALVLPVIPSLGLKETALASAFSSGSAGGGAAIAAGGGAAASTAVAGGGALAAKALVAVALVGGGTAATVTVARDGERAAPAPARSAGAAEAVRTPAAGSLPAGLPGGMAGTLGAAGDEDDQGNTARGRKTRTRTRAGRRRAVRARGRAGAPGQLRKDRAKRLKKPNGSGRGAPARSPKLNKAKPRAQSPSPVRARPKVAAPRAPRPARIAPAPAVPRPVKPLKPAPVPTAAPTVAPAPTIEAPAAVPQGPKKLK